MDFIRRHWKAYLAGAVLAVALGIGASIFILAIGSTPPDV